ncbi:MAG: hypothetical protein HY518_05400, partial [Candidatus Aenigmarchaeota archaeon]|nr:hypothetical protein [Candidatus Aenigmarchaeota archaeon]
MDKAKPVFPGTLRIDSKGLKVYVKTASSWKESPARLPEAMHVIRLFRAHNMFDFLIDRKNPRFLKGQLSPDGKCQGARINILPDGRKLDKAYSLFARQLTIHDETSNTHWDVLYMNPGGTYSYIYTLEKRQVAVREKYREVEDFERLYPKLERNVLLALRDQKDAMAVPMYTLLKTRMRIGNEIYYKAHGHKGLATLKKGDISIAGNRVTFNYLSKGGVPVNTTVEFPDSYMNRLKVLLKGKDDSSYIFTTESGHPLSDSHFKVAFRRYCGRGFYPHIVRSYHATRRAKEFLATHSTATKKEIREFFTLLAEDLGHKRFSKKDQQWKDSYTVTIHSYIQPEVLERVQALA